MTLRDAFLRQATVCPQLGSPFMGQLCGLLADMLDSPGPVFERMRAWPGDVSAAGHSVPLRLCGALHGLVIDGTAPELAAVYPPNQTDDDALRRAVLAAISTHETRIQAWLDNAPQTNEVRRSTGIIAVGQWLSNRCGLPFNLLELGASAGLNLQWDRMALDLPDVRFGPDDATLRLSPDWTGPLPPQAPVHVTRRRGVDLSPLSIADEGDVLRLRAYLWPDQPDRRARTDAAIKLAHKHKPEVAAGDAAPWLERVLQDLPEGEITFIYHTIAWQYFPQETKERCAAAIVAAGARATENAPLAWLGIEADDQKPGAGMCLRLWPDDVTLNIGRMDFHGRWLIWTPPS
ncbi:hypothetical protein ACMU_09125 [Actibacterium mucosum KCTC 23349]|uniref:DUF2332 domain-containing protein n=1 Tax=Actibacterium mucosum KCTC 23349 TaxID=1454373 RepID=A0A037ZJY7_9RHOB|nr:DUF2332 family protein [Actibacterium mucosum]KAJ55919.1 hypothetical protein ACMU_09125 [Actibacterium mucosum KCTC 23349]